MAKDILRTKKKSQPIYKSTISLFFFLFITLLFLNFSNNIYAQKLSDSISLKANAGEDQIIEEGQPVILKAEDSLSSRPPIDSYLWLQTEPQNPSVDLENSNTSRASFIAPNLPNDQDFVFQLIVKDQNVSDTDTVNIYVTEDLSAMEDGSPTSSRYEPEKCFDGKDNDFDGKIDVQDEDCSGGGSLSSPNQPPNQLLQQIPPQQQQQINPQPLPELPPQLQDQQQGRLLSPQQGQTDR